MILRNQAYPKDESIRNQTIRKEKRECHHKQKTRYRSTPPDSAPESLKGCIAKRKCLTKGKEEAYNIPIERGSGHGRNDKRRIQNHYGNGTHDY